MRVYISGPITGVEGYAEIFAAAARYLEKSGHEVINPAALAGGTEWQWADWILYDLEHLRQAQAIALLPGWDESRGCRVERAFADGLGLFILYVRRCFLDANMAAAEAREAPE